jgi:hypothetical protein
MFSFIFNVQKYEIKKLGLTGFEAFRPYQA